MVPAITLLPFHHRGEEVIGLKCNLELMEKQLRRIKGVKWCGEKNMWYVPLSRESYEIVKAAVKEVATLDSSLLKRYLEQRNASAPLLTKDKVSKARAQLLLDYPLSKENLEAFEKYQRLLLLKGYSQNTLKTYGNEFHVLLRLLSRVAVSTLTKEHLHSYLLWLIQKRGYSEAHMHTAVNAIKFYFEQVEENRREFYDLPRPKKPAKLPSILAEEEVDTSGKAVEIWPLNNGSLVINRFQYNQLFLEQLALVYTDVAPVLIGDHSIDIYFNLPSMFIMYSGTKRGEAFPIRLIVKADGLYNSKTKQKEYELSN